MTTLSLVSKIDHKWGIPFGHLYIAEHSDLEPTNPAKRFVWRGQAENPGGYEWYDPFTGSGGAGDVVFAEFRQPWLQSSDYPDPGEVHIGHEIGSYTTATFNEYLAAQDGFLQARNYINDGDYLYNFLYQNSNTVIRYALDEANEKLSAIGADLLDTSLPNDGAWTPGYNSVFLEEPFQGNGLTLVPFLLYEASQWFFQQGTNLVNVLKQNFDSITDWITQISSGESIDPTEFAIDMDYMLDTLLDIEKGFDVASQIGSDDVDTLIADAANGWLLGGGGNDTFQFNNSGNDTFVGGEGNDLASFFTSDSGLTIDLENEYAAVGSNFKDTLLEIENVTGTNYADVIRGTAESNTITGGEGNDNLSSRGGKDTFIHAIGDGSDILNGFTNDLSDVIMQFDDPDDVYLNVYSQDLFVTNGDTGEQLTLKGQYYDTVSGYEFSTLNGEDITGGLTIRGTSPTAAEAVHGTTYADTIDGGLGNDALYGHGGADVFIHEVGDGTDQIYEVEGAQATVLMNGVSANDLYFNVYAEDLIVTDISNGEQLYLHDQYANVDGVKEFASVNGINVNYGLLIRGTSDTLGEIIHGTKYVDTIIGGLGDDAIYGMGAADTFIHTSGDGTDNIFAQSLNELASVTLSISENDIEFNVIGGDLRVTDTTSGNVLYLKNQYLGQASGYEFNYVNTIDVTGGLEIAGTGSLYGTSNNDTIEGNYTAQVIKGNDGDDMFISSGGADNLYGEGGDDTFVFDSLTDSTTSVTDKIYGFVRGEDVIDFSQIASIDEYSDLTVTAYGGSTYIDDVGSSFRLWTMGTTGLDATDFIFT